MLRQRWNHPVIVENKPGASGNIGIEIVAKAPPDGYTLLTVVTPVAINPALFTNLPFDFMRDIAPVIYLALERFNRKQRAKIRTLLKELV